MVWNFCVVSISMIARPVAASSNVRSFLRCSSEDLSAVVSQNSTSPSLRSPSVIGSEGTVEQEAKNVITSVGMQNLFGKIFNLIKNSNEVVSDERDDFCLLNPNNF